MIKTLTISNFQSHPKSELELSPGVNVIIGSSDSGKTAIIRALRKLTWNRPLGDTFRSHWGGDTVIIAETDGGTISRDISKTDSYTLSTDQAANQFKAFGTSVPEEITNLLNITTLNLQSQLDSPFLLTSSPGEVAQHFNKIARIDQIDSSRKKVETRLRSLDQDVKHDMKNVARYKEQLEGFAWLEKFEIDLEVLEGAEEKRLQKIQSNQKLISTLKSIKTTEEEIAAHSYLLGAEKQVNNLLEQQELVQGKSKEKEQLSTHLLTLTNVREEIKEQQELIQDETLVISLIGLYENKDQVETKRNDIQTLLNGLEGVAERLMKQRDYLDNIEKKFHDEFPDFCPLCGMEQSKI